jgi:indole-3-glycerol phosphate synthase
LGVLDNILSAKRDQIDKLRSTRLPVPPLPRPFSLKREAGPLKLIAEIKRRSPSAGPLSTALSIGERAQAYEAAGASMVSVLCDSAHFDGSFEHLSQARAACSLPLLCKDFILDESQLDAARAYGANAVLLIVRCLSPRRVTQLVHSARLLSLEPLVEVATEAEATIAVDSGAQLIGVNARDLDTLEIDSARAARVLEALPSSVTCVHLSGLATAADVAKVAASKADAALIGEALMRLDDPAPLLREMGAAAAHRA